MSHIDVDIIDFLLLTVYPVIALFIVELICRAVAIPTWIKLSTQGIISMGFAIGYITLLVSPHWLTSLVLFALAIALFYQARRAKINPNKDINY